MHLPNCIDVIGRSFGILHYINSIRSDNYNSNADRPEFILYDPYKVRFVASNVSAKAQKETIRELTPTIVP